MMHELEAVYTFNTENASYSECQPLTRAPKTLLFKPLLGCCSILILAPLNDPETLNSTTPFAPNRKPPKRPNPLNPKLRTCLCPGPPASPPWSSPLQRASAEESPAGAGRGLRLRLRDGGFRWGV